MQIMKIILAAGTLLSCVACGGQTGDTKGVKDTLNLVELTNTANSGGRHFFLRIVNERLTDSSVVYTVKSLYEKDTVGLNFEFSNNIPAGVKTDGTVDEQQGFSEGSLKISSIGLESDKFVKALSTLLNTGSPTKMTDKVIMPTVYSSNKVAVDLSKIATYSFKIFIPNVTQVPAELFFKLDLYKKSIEFSEKSPEFRAGLVAAFTE